MGESVLRGTWKQEQFNSVNVMHANGDELNLVLQSLLVLFTFFLSFLLDKRSQGFCSFLCNFFTAKHYRSRCRYTVDGKI